jgi:hypothetical protein
MPPKLRLNVDDLIEALLDGRVVDALGQSLGSKIGEIVEARIDAKFKSLQESFSTLKADYVKADKVISELRGENQSLKSQLEDLDSYSRVDNLIIHGLNGTSCAEASSSPMLSTKGQGPSDISPLDTHFETEIAVLDFANNVLGVPLNLTDISVAHRLPKRPNDSNPAPIIVRFSNRRSRNAVYSARKALAGQKPAIYINEHLTKRRAVLLREARQLVKAKKLQGAWSANGNIFIRLSDLPTSRPLRVNDMSDLPRG